MNTSIVFALVILAVRLMTWLKVFKGEGDRRFVGILGLSHGALVLGLTCSCMVGYEGIWVTFTWPRTKGLLVFYIILFLCMQMVDQAERDQ